MGVARLVDVDEINRVNRLFNDMDRDLKATREALVMLVKASIADDKDKMDSSIQNALDVIGGANLPHAKMNSLDGGEGEGVDPLEDGK